MHREPKQPDLGHARLDTRNAKGITLAIIFGVSKYLNIQVPGKVVEDDVMVFINGGVTHNFIDEGFVAKKNLLDEYFISFKVENAKGKISLCDKVV